MTRTIDDLEIAAYMACDTDRADLLARVAELEAQVEALEMEIEETETLEGWEKNHGPAQEYWAFFHDCFAALDAHYPAPNVSSDYDKSVILDAIRKGEGSED